MFESFWLDVIYILPLTEIYWLDVIYILPLTEIYWKIKFNGVDVVSRRVDVVSTSIESFESFCNV